MAAEAARLNKEQTHGKKKEKVCLDITRPSHGRTWPQERRVPVECRGSKFGGKLVVSSAGQAYDAQAASPNRESQLIEVTQT